MLLGASTAGEVAPWVVIAVGFIGNAWISRRGAVGDALGYLERTNRLQHRELEQLKRERQDFISKIAALESRTDFARSLMPITKTLQEHEERAAQRFLSTLHILNLIAKQLGADEIDIHA